MKTVLNLTLRSGSVACLLLLGAALLGGAGPAQAAPAEWVERQGVLMGTRLRVRVAASSREAGLAATEAVFAEVRRLDAVLSSWRDDSEIGRVNAAPHCRPTPVADELWTMLEEARTWAGRTGGAFHPGVGALVDAWGLRGEGRLPSDPELGAALAASGPGAFRWDPEERSVARLSGAAWIDTGGFGKGAALRAAARVLRARGVRSALLDFGGQLLAVGEPPEGGWEVAVAHPSRRDEPAFQLRLRSGSVSTSSQSERFVAHGKERFGHVLDPRSGRPVAAWGSVTVVADDALVADVLSTALLVMGPAEAAAFADTLTGVGVLLLEERDGEVVPRWNAALEQFRAYTTRPTEESE